MVLGSTWRSVCDAIAQKCFIEIKGLEEAHPWLLLIHLVLDKALNGTADLGNGGIELRKISLDWNMEHRPEDKP